MVLLYYRWDKGDWTDDTDQVKISSPIYWEDCGLCRRVKITQWGFVWYRIARATLTWSIAS